MKKVLPNDRPAWAKRISSLVYQRRGGREGYDLRQAAKESGISHTTLSRIERGAMPDLRTFRKLCIWLGKSADDLLGLKERDDGAA